jgi:hypothetical protein
VLPITVPGLRPHSLDRGELPAEAGHPMRQGRSEDLIVVRPAAQRHPEGQSAARDAVDHRGLLGDQHLVAVRQGQGGGGQADPLGHGGGRGERGERIPQVIIGTIDRAQRVEAGFIGESDPVQKEAPLQPERHRVR